MGNSLSAAAGQTVDAEDLYSYNSQLAQDSNIITYLPTDELDRDKFVTSLKVLPFTSSFTFIFPGVVEIARLPTRFSKYSIGSEFTIVSSMTIELDGTKLSLPRQQDTSWLPPLVVSLNVEKPSAQLDASLGADGQFVPYNKNLYKVSAARVFVELETTSTLTVPRLKQFAINSNVLPSLSYIVGVPKLALDMLVQHIVTMLPQSNVMTMYDRAGINSDEAPFVLRFITAYARLYPSTKHYESGYYIVINYGSSSRGSNFTHAAGIMASTTVQTGALFWATGTLTINDPQHAQQVSGGMTVSVASNAVEVWKDPPMLSWTTARSFDLTFFSIASNNIKTLMTLVTYGARSNICFVCECRFVLAASILSDIEKTEGLYVVQVGSRFLVHNCKTSDAKNSLLYPSNKSPFSISYGATNKGANWHYQPSSPYTLSTSNSLAVSDATVFPLVPAIKPVQGPSYYDTVPEMSSLVSLTGDKFYLFVSQAPAKLSSSFLLGQLMYQKMKNFCLVSAGDQYLPSGVEKIGTVTATQTLTLYAPTGLMTTSEDSNGVTLNFKLKDQPNRVYIAKTPNGLSREHGYLQVYMGDLSLDQFNKTDSELIYIPSSLNNTFHVQKRFANAPRDISVFAVGPATTDISKSILDTEGMLELDCVKDPAVIYLSGLQGDDKAAERGELSYRNYVDDLARWFENSENAVGLVAVLKISKLGTHEHIGKAKVVSGPGDQLYNYLVIEALRSSDYKLVTYKTESDLLMPAARADVRLEFGSKYHAVEFDSAMNSLATPSTVKINSRVLRNSMGVPFTRGIDYLTVVPPFTTMDLGLVLRLEDTTVPFTSSTINIPHGFADSIIMLMSGNYLNIVKNLARLKRTSFVDLKWSLVVCITDDIVFNNTSVGVADALTKAGVSHTSVYGFANNICVISNVPHNIVNDVITSVAQFRLLTTNSPSPSKLHLEINCYSGEMYNLGDIWTRTKLLDDEDIRIFMLSRFDQLLGATTLAISGPAKDYPSARCVRLLRNLSEQQVYYLNDKVQNLPGLKNTVFIALQRELNGYFDIENIKQSVILGRFIAIANKTLNTVRLIDVAKSDRNVDHILCEITNIKDGYFYKFGFTPQANMNHISIGNLEIQYQLDAMFGYTNAPEFNYSRYQLNERIGQTPSFMTFETPDSQSQSLQFLESTMAFVFSPAVKLPLAYEAIGERKHMLVVRARMPLHPEDNANLFALEYRMSHPKCICVLLDSVSTGAFSQSDFTLGSRSYNGSHSSLHEGWRAFPKSQGFKINEGIQIDTSLFVVIPECKDTVVEKPIRITSTTVNYMAYKKNMVSEFIYTYNWSSYNIYLVDLEPPK